MKLAFLALATGALVFAQAEAGQQDFERVCGECHGLELSTGLKMSAAAWRSTVNRMLDKGASASRDEVELIVKYLAKNFGEEAAKPSAAAAAQMPEGAGKQVILRECTACHLPDHFIKYRHSGEEWQAIVSRMGTRVKSATRDELDQVLKYLSTNFPKVEDATRLNVNKSTAKDIAERLSLTAAEAAAIVEYRSRHGEFKEWGELLAIYGVDGLKIEAIKDRISF